MASTDIPVAEAKVRLASAEIACKRARARVFLTATGNNEERKAQAEVHEDTAVADIEYVEAIREFEALRAKRQRAELVIELFRTLEASRRRAA